MTNYKLEQVIVRGWSDKRSEVNEEMRKVELKKPERVTNVRHFIASRNTLEITIPQKIVIDAGLDKMYNEHKEVLVLYDKKTKRVIIDLYPKKETQNVEETTTEVQNTTEQVKVE